MSSDRTAERVLMDYFHKIRSTVTQVAAQVSNALPGNPLTREYEVSEQIATAGPGLHWKVYAAKKKSTMQPVAVWLFEKREMDKWSKEDKEEFLNTIKAKSIKGVSQLTRLRHPRLLVVEHAIEESRDSLAFATEPVFASLANCLGRRDNFTGEPPSYFNDFAFHDVEIRHGLLQIAEALAFLHIDARMLHRNVCPDSIIINERGAWKLGGFDFALQGTPGNNNSVTFDTFDYNEGRMAVGQPFLEYLAPEYALGGRAGSYADIFSLGITTFAIFNKGKAPIKYNGRLDNVKKNADKWKSVPETCLAGIPFNFRDDYKQCLNYTPDLRPDATQFTKMAYFDDPLVKTLNYFESLMQMDNQQKMAFFKGLPQVISRFEKRVLLQKVLPYLSGEFTTPDLIPFILPSVFIITEQASKKEFTDTILPALVPVFSMQKPYQIVLLLLQRMELLLAKAEEVDVKKYVLPLIYNSIGNETTRIQELCLSIIPSIGPLVDRQSMKMQLLPKLLKLATEGSVIAVRVQALVCIGKLLPTLESWMVTEQVLPAMPRITSKEPGVLMSILGIYKLAFDSDKVGIGREQLARSALPFLIANLVENTLNLAQFEQFSALVNQMLGRVEKEQRNRLQQLSAGEEAQRSVPSFDSVLSGAATGTGGGGEKDISSDLAGLMGASSIGGGAKAPPKTGGALTLEEKKRLAAEQNRGAGGAMNGAAPLAPMSTSHSSSTATQKVSPKPSGVPMDPFDSLLSMGPSSSSKPTRPAFDVNDFMPKSSSSSSSFFPSVAAPPPPPPSSSNPLFFPGPPRSTNAPVGRPSSQGANPLDSLFAFPGQKSAVPMNSMNNSTLPAFGGAPGGMGGTMGLGSMPALAPTSKANNPPPKDPFADLLG